MSLWIGFSALGDWVKNTRLLSNSPTNQIQNQNQLTLGTHGCPRLALVTCISFELLLAHCVAFVCCDWSL